MKRQSIADAAARVSAPGLPDLPSDDGQEAVSLVVRGGELIAIVPRDTRTDRSKPAHWCCAAACASKTSAC